MNEEERRKLNNVKDILEKEKLKEVLGKKCIYCGCDNPLFLELDHKIPKCRGGEDDNKNKQVTCVLCNRLKGGLNDKEFKKYVKLLLELKKLNKVTFKFKKDNALINFTPDKYPLTLEEVNKKLGEEDEL